MRDDTDLQSLAAALLDAARAAGADQADAVAVSASSLSVEVRGGALEHAERADGTEIGLRVLIGGRQACVSASELSRDTMREMAERAVAMAREAPVDDALALAQPGEFAQSHEGDLQLMETAAPPTPEALQDSALRAEAAALSVNGARMIDVAGASFLRRDMYLATSNGFANGYGRSSHSVSAVAITGEGTAMERDWAGEGRVWAEDMPPPEEIGLLAGQRTVARAGARKPPTGAVPVLFDQRVAGGLIGHLLSAANGSAVARGATWLRDALGEQVLPEGFDLDEDPRRPRYSASRPHDAEGLPTRPRAIVRNGVLQGWTLDLATANKLGMESTANAVRGTSSPPSPGVSNTRLTPGTASPEQLIRDMGRGLIVTSFLGASINATTGDYSRGASGFWVEGGQIAYPVNECTIAGNLREMLMRLTAADDLPEWRTHQVPSLLVEGLTLAGN
ncbi:TldD/PmbA family protein [Paracoccus sp. Z118]|uniref:TldD/PmbA family protein n=1 Tax=Paracoccus sp. Z118 TaxID=2851017 RepID=UPI001C2BF6B6|nr:TldD/PmbA family protein [Paracoccus sp. Z118]MBV0891964.1 TldD/PmbA family protein [Paracoccus sp. Z118]